jgi:general secretion pathway protein E/type IV pilus assembly protein PilB
VTPAEDFILDLLEAKGVIVKSVIDGLRSQLESGSSGCAIDQAKLESLISAHGVSPMQLAALLAESFDMEAVDLSNSLPSSAALDVVGYDLARKYNALPLEVDDVELKIAVSNPLDTDATDTISHLSKRSVTCCVAPQSAIMQAIQEHYGRAEIGSTDNADPFLDEKIGGSASSSPMVEMPVDSKEEGPIIGLVQRIISEGSKRRASDIHLEPLEKRFRIRYRVDGILHEVEDVPKRLHPSIVSRIKLMANLSIAEKRLPQDGRIHTEVNSKVIDLRVSTLPTSFGESIVIRILDKEELALGLPQLGLWEDDQAAFERMIAMPDGVFLVVGPTGSGKSTTLYAALSYLNRADRKIITVEDPVEYEIFGINQVQVCRDVGMTFAAALRSVLRQAPNIIMVGEIRDRETAEIAVNASLTGHMVFSTLHANDAPSAVTRLMDIGIKPFLLSASLRAVLAQRLVRRNCVGCKQSDEPNQKLSNALGISRHQLTEAKLMKGKGCVKCNSTGFRGRVGIFELFTLSETLEQMVYAEASLLELRNKMKEMGMRTMRDDGVRKVLAGLTTCEEVLHVTVADSA